MTAGAPAGGTDRAGREPAASQDRALPSFLVIGAQRAGTSLLHEILAAHPEIYVPPQRKELHYFDRYHDRGLGWYASYFPEKEAAGTYAAIGETTPDYLAIPEVAPRIAAALPGCRLVAILRNPVDRAYSWYQYCRRNRNERRGVEEFLDNDPTALDWGLYGEHLARYRERCAGHPLLVLVYEDLVREPGPELERLAGFLSLSRPFTEPDAMLQRKVNSSEVPRFRRGFAAARRFGGFLMKHDLNWPVRVAKRLGVQGLFGRAPKAPPLAPEVRARLQAYYAEDVARLSALAGRDLGERWFGR